MRRHWILYALKVAFFISVGFFLFGWVIMKLWNLTVPSLFSGPMITFSQALGIFVISRLLLCGVRPLWKGKSNKRGYWRRKMEKHLSSMTPEEKEKLRQAYARRCGQWQEEEKQKEENRKEVVNQ
ncbi:hypothetical protein [Xanthocytophaga flava]|uniref:hypothetical protein n=1 Tax=Xanthocytophaga flava TaxID=3048013 RepID=UPI0028D0793B|nr:hypothetical protein [Xanthocytophaga flavus]MDJ1466420.1 hypothetical protein [Xanthocytophaga flavus]